MEDEVLKAQNTESLQQKKGLRLRLYLSPLLLPEKEERKPRGPPLICKNPPNRNREEDQASWRLL